VQPEGQLLHSLAGKDGISVGFFDEMSVVRALDQFKGSIKERWMR
jgi:hypothetical protein